MAAAGEWLRTREGFGSSQAWTDTSIGRQLEYFTPAGMYRDPNDPLAYDHFARLWVLDLVDERYSGPSAATLNALLERGAWASLLMQSPHGELPCGGRSAHHQWNEAEQAVTCESFARRFARLGVNEPCRNGFMDAAYAESSGRSIRCRVTLSRASGPKQPRPSAGSEDPASSENPLSRDASAAA